MKTEIPKRTEVIFANSIFCIADKPDATRPQIRQTVQRINHCAIRTRIDRIHREIPPRRVFGNIGRKRYGCASAIGRDISAKSRHFVRQTTLQERHGAMIDTRRHNLDPGTVGEGHNLIRRRIGGNVDIADIDIQQRIANAPADEQNLRTIAA